MNDILQLIKKAALEAVAASKPCTTYVGKVKSASPLQIQVGQKLVLDDEFVDVTQTAAERMATGSRVLLIRQAGGQKYTAIDTLK